MKRKTKMSNGSKRGMSASLPHKNSGGFRIADDGHAIATLCDMLSILSGKPHLGTGAFHNIGYSFAKNIIRHNENHPFGNIQF